MVITHIFIFAVGYAIGARHKPVSPIDNASFLAGYTFRLEGGRLVDTRERRKTEE